MLLFKRTSGYVVQAYDTETKRFVSQRFMPHNNTQWTYKNKDAQPPNPEPCFPFNMEQPEPEELVVHEGYEKLAERAKKIAAQLFSEDTIRIEFEETDEFTDGWLTFNSTVGIVAVVDDDDKIIGYQVCRFTYVPGGMHSIPETDITDIGAAHGLFDNAVKAALLVVAEEVLEDLFLYADEERRAQEEEEWDDMRKDRLAHSG